MNKLELIRDVSETAQLRSADAASAVSATLAAIAKALKDGRVVTLLGFGTFEVRTRSARRARNPRTGASIVVPEGKVVKFRPGKALKDSVQ